MQKTLIFSPFLIALLTQGSILVSSNSASPVPTASPQAQASSSGATQQASPGLVSVPAIRAESSNENNAKAAVAISSSTQTIGPRRGSLDTGYSAAILSRPSSAFGHGPSNGGSSKSASKHVGPSKGRCQNLQALTSHLKVEVDSFQDRISSEQPTSPKSASLWSVKKKLCAQVLKNLKIAAGALSFLMEEDFVQQHMFEIITKADADRTPSPVAPRSASGSVSSAPAASGSTVASPLTTKK
jgi:hypothetical protein